MFEPHAAFPGRSGTIGFRRRNDVGKCRRGTKSGEAFQKATTLKLIRFHRNFLRVEVSHEVFRGYAYEIVPHMIADHLLVANCKLESGAYGIFCSSSH